MYYNLDISALSIVLLVLTAVFAVYAAVAGLAPMRRVARKEKIGDASSEAPDESLPPLSVVVHALNDESHIASFLTALLDQDYPDYEIIVVNDASIDNTSEIVESIAEGEDRIRVSFVPDSAINVSRRKTAFTLGLKAARNGVALITSSKTDIPSRQWLRRMGEPFADSGIEVCLGLTHLSPELDSGFGRRWRAFDSMTVKSQWLGYALAGLPYRGDSCNLAFRRDRFFANRGFASSNRYHTGEDDIFVNEIAASDNTAVVTACEARPEVLLPASQYPRLWLRNKERHTFTSRYLRTAALRMQALHSASLWLGLVCGVAASVIALPNLFPASAAIVLWTLLAGYQICVYKRAAAFLGARPLRASVPLYWLLRPVLNGLYRLRFRSTRSTNYTWRAIKTS